MSRAALAAIVGLAAAAVVLAPEAAPRATDSHATAAECSWQRKSKRVVRVVKRHGERRRLARVKHWWACVPVAAVPAPAAAPAAPATPSVPVVPAPIPPPPELERISVKADDEVGETWKFTLSRPSVEAGEVLVELNNKSGDPHNLNLQHEGIGGEPVLEVSEAGPLEHRSGRFTLAPGNYRLWCSLPEHEEKGMQANLVVAGA